MVVFSLSHGDITVPLEIPPNLVRFAGTQRDEFLASTATAPTSRIPTSTLELTARFSMHVARGEGSDRDGLLESLLDHLDHNILQGNDIHTAVVETIKDKQSKTQAIQSYYEALIVANRPIKPRGTSALLNAAARGQAGLHLLFGGQGNNEHYFDEIRNVFSTYKPLVRTLAESLGQRLQTLARNSSVSDLYPHGLDVLRWLEAPDSTPSTDALVAAPVSFPLIGVLQLLHVKAVFVALGVAPGDLSRLLQGVAGHSQGLVTALAVSAASTWDEFDDLAVKAVEILFWIGARCQQVLREENLSEKDSLALVTDGHGTPSSMLSISNIHQRDLEKIVTGLNGRLPVEQHVYTALKNTGSNFVISGPVRSLAALINSCKAASAGARTGPQARVPYSQRKLSPSMQFLPVTVPCHSKLLDDAVPLIDQDLRNVSISNQALKVPVNRQSADSSDFVTIYRDEEGQNLVPLVIRKITSEPVDWTEIDFTGATHVVDFGPGLSGGVGNLTHRNLLGSGTRILVAGKLDSQPEGPQGSLAELFSPDERDIQWAPRWEESHRASLVRTASGPVVVSSLSRLLGLPPFFVAGMTPTTTHPEFVAAVMRAGYHVEFAAGGYHDASSLQSALTRLRDMIPPGRGITINVIYVSPKAIAWQIPLVRQLRGQGFPLTGLTVGGGVPSLEVATEYITTLGLEHISFKPSSAESIRQVLRIAAENPSFPVILQWTGGRGGGHHSAEDFHAPILETYGEIRARDNVHLVAGSGFGSGDDVLPYLTGTWSLSRGKKSPMPFDGALFGSRVMTCAEALTSRQAKLEIVAAQGVEDAQWDGTYRGSTGGVVSVVSEMGEPIHIIANRGGRLWAELDRTVFSLDRKKRAAVIASKKGYIISRLNEDFQRPWFGVNAQGVHCDIADMTYKEVVERVIKLMFAGGRWVDQSHPRLLFDFLSQIEARFSEIDSSSLVGPKECDSDPSRIAEKVLQAFPGASTTLLCPEDVDFFVQLCRRPGAKPVPFVPVLDDGFETFFKKDSLWQSENLDTVVDQDAGRVFILHGPVAARHTTTIDEPVGDVLDAINASVYRHFLAEAFGGDEASIPYEECLQRTLSAAAGPAATDQLDIVLPERNNDLRAPFSGVKAGWQAALFGSRFVVQGQDLIPNPLLHLHDALNADDADINEDTVSIFSEAGHGKRALLVEAMRHLNEIRVALYTHLTGPDTPVPLLLKFRYHPETSFAPIREVIDDRNERIGDMYRQLWTSGSESTTTPGPSESRADLSTFDGTYTCDEALVRDFNRAVGYRSPTQHERVLLDFAIVVGWSPICQALLQKSIQGDVLKLVHLSNAYEVHSGAEGLKVGDTLRTRARVSSTTIDDSGKTVEIVCVIRRADGGSALITVRSRFLFRGKYTDFTSTFARKVEPPYELKIRSNKDIGILASKPWLHIADGNKLADLNLNDLTLEFHLETVTRWASESTRSSIDTSGKVFTRSESGDLSEIGIVKHHVAQSSSNPVLPYLQRRGKVVDSRTTHQLPTPGPSTKARIRIPWSNEPYSRVSGDYNPIHTSPLFAQIAGLPGTITHGMYCSAVVRQTLERHAAGGHPSRIRHFGVSFVGMVLPSDTLSVSLQHTGLQDGLMVYDINVFNDETGHLVLHGSALVAQPSTTILFTGQGSQEKGMGMDLYASSPVARAIWDRADAYFVSQFGLSILEIVRTNPKRATVYFGGVRGRQLRHNYISMSYEVPGGDRDGGGGGGGKPQRRPLFPTITEQSTSYTHSSPHGLLFATQFSQPALTIMEMAAFKDMQASGVVGGTIQFAGHSLGEYAALASVTDFMPFESLMYLVFCRGMTMQGAVERDEMGRSSFSMVAVDPSRVSSKFTEHGLRDLITAIQTQTGFFVEIVNLNIRNGQYVCAGDLRALDLLQRSCDAIKSLSSSHTASGYLSIDALTSIVRDNGAGYADVAPQQIELKRGGATVPLAGVDVPFHSSFLRSRMEAFRRVLQDSLSADRLKPSLLVGRYIPNVTGTPFSLEKGYIEEAFRVTNSEPLGEVLGNWGEWMKRVTDERDTIATVG
ncbi:Fatty acid synthase [Colletotrichum higginsianum IMI 349063]|uniref:Fatty acid synthase n=2 Tax=Colletotrichum higginsianum TaxID=80884 RepID=A0A1B7Y0V0_COLHI|nr:Fatty acid synthase [Colletotrichum higginsianum IMI 349063]OBR05648.1 Fatty acid synthase [Colletotrichum higginsianum IMI 349063]TIC90653.1 Fatty acid synthase subunit beta [Colletotrichum higginsianum]